MCSVSLHVPTADSVYRQALCCKNFSGGGKHSNFHRGHSIQPPRPVMGWARFVQGVRQAVSTGPDKACLGRLGLRDGKGKGGAGQGKGKRDSCERQPRGVDASPDTIPSYPQTRFRLGNLGNLARQAGNLASNLARHPHKPDKPRHQACL